MSVALLQHHSLGHGCRPINIASVTPPWQRRRSNTIAAPGEQQARRGGEGIACVATPTPSVRARAIKKGLCHSTSATAATERNRGARGLTSTQGGRGAARATTPTPSVGMRAINTVSSNPSQQEPQPNTIAAPEEQRVGRGGQGATRAATPRPSVGARAINAASATSPQQQLRPNAIAAQGERQAWGGDEGLPAQQCGQHLPSTCRPSTMC